MTLVERLCEIECFLGTEPKQSIGMTLAVRNLMTDLRSSGEVTGGPKSFAPRDRSAFLSALDQAIRRVRRAQDRT